MTPALGLSYSSDQGNGVVGVGFGISGLSAIQRCPSNLALHQRIKEVDYRHDEFCLDGKPLTRLGSDSSTEYRTYPDTITRIVPHYHTADYDQPAWFEVFQPSGLISYYGWDGEAARDSGARPEAPGGVYQKWQLFRTTDRAGNSIT